MEDAINKASDNNWNEKIVFIEGNKVTVKLREKGGNSYLFFNDIVVSVLSDEEEYIFLIGNYN